MDDKLEERSEATGGSKSTVSDLQEQNRSLSINEVLYLLRSRVCPGRGIPEQLENPPWRIPKDAHSRSSVVNVILNQSAVVQSSNIPGSGDFDECVLSNASLTVAGLMRCYLQAVLPTEMTCDVVLGVLLWDPAAREGPDDYEGTPYLWLEIAGCPIDNAYVDIPRTDANLEYFYKAKQANSYRKESPWSSTGLRLYLGQEGDSQAEVLKHNFKVFRHYGNNENVEKFVVFALANADLNPGVKMYDLLMRDFLKKTYGVEPGDMEQKWSKRCWGCGKEDGVQLLTCTKCKKAKYCGTECQKTEWPIHKLLHRELALTREILSQED